MNSIDILFVADPRFPGGTSTALASELVAAHDAGFSTGLLMVRGPLLRRPHSIHPELARHINAGRVRVVEPEESISAALVIIHHPTLFQYLPVKRLQVRAERVVVVLPHPELDATGTPQYDLPAVLGNVGAVFGLSPLLAPVGVNVRASLKPSSVGQYEVLGENWPHLIDLEQWPARPPDRPVAERPIIGRHSRPDPAKWPDTREEAISIYPDERDFDVRVLGGGMPDSYGVPPSNWSILPFAHTGISEFLQALDFYVYFHSSAWVEAFGRTVLEALATGLVVILPRSFEPQFGTAALYAEPHEVRALLNALSSDPERFREQSVRARREVEARYSLDRFASHIAKVAPDLRSRSTHEPLAEPTPSAKRLLFISSNGIGLGHLSRQMAIARRLADAVTPIFLTMSHAFRLVLDQGFSGEFIPFHRSLGADPQRWNAVLAEEVFAALNFYRPDAVVFDGNNPYPGMLDAFATRPEMLSIWVRRPMWRERHQQSLLRAGEFDFIIEPGEVAAQFDRGPTRAVADYAHKVAPVCFLDSAELMERSAARVELGIPEESTAVCVQLGSGNNFDLSAVRQRVLEELLGHKDVFIVELRSPIRDIGETDRSLDARHRIVESYPSSRYLHGFDFSVSAAGYNSFHENLMALLPTLFIPNEAEEMDLQLARARFAELTGLGRLLRRQDIYAVPAVIAEMMDAEQRRLMRQRCATLPPMSGAREAARFIEVSLKFARTDFDIADADYGQMARHR